jgi:hypothetical protein
MFIRWSTLAIYLAVVWLLLPARLSAQKKDEVKKDKSADKEIVLKGTLTSIEQEVTHFADLKKDVVYIITMESRGFFTAMHIANGQGQQVGSLSGSSTFKASESGRFKLVIYSPGGSSGQYAINMWPLHLTPTKPGEILAVGPDGLYVEAILTKDDPLDNVRKKHCRTYDVQLMMNSKYVIDMISKQFDSFLRLENAFGKQLAQDDDSGGNNNARIRFTAPADGIYRIYATSFGKQGGLFELKVREEKKEPTRK